VLSSCDINLCFVRFVLRRLKIVVCDFWGLFVESEMAAVGKRVWQLSRIGAFGAFKSQAYSSFQRPIFHPFPVSGTRHFSQLVKSNGKHLFLVDTLALVIIYIFSSHLFPLFRFHFYLQFRMSCYVANCLLQFIDFICLFDFSGIG